MGSKQSTESPNHVVEEKAVAPVEEVYLPADSIQGVLDHYKQAHRSNSNPNLRAKMLLHLSNMLDTKFPIAASQIANVVKPLVEAPELDLIFLSATSSIPSLAQESRNACLILLKVHCYGEEGMQMLCDRGWLKSFWMPIFRRVATRVPSDCVENGQSGLKYLEKLDTLVKILHRMVAGSSSRLEMSLEAGAFNLVIMALNGLLTHVEADNAPINSFDFLLRFLEGWNRSIVRRMIDSDGNDGKDLLAFVLRLFRVSVGPLLSPSCTSSKNPEKMVSLLEEAEKRTKFLRVAHSSGAEVALNFLRMAAESSNWDTVSSVFLADNGFFLDILLALLQPGGKTIIMPQSIQDTLQCSVADQQARCAIDLLECCLSHELVRQELDARDAYGIIYALLNTTNRPRLYFNMSLVSASLRFCAARVSINETTKKDALDSGFAAHALYVYLNGDVDGTLGAASLMEGVFEEMLNDSSPGLLLRFVRLPNFWLAFKKYAEDPHTLRYHNILIKMLAIGPSFVNSAHPNPFFPFLYSPAKDAIQKLERASLPTDELEEQLVSYMLPSQ